jgi:hypothetical protein
MHIHKGPRSVIRTVVESATVDSIDIRELATRHRDRLFRAVLVALFLGLILAQIIPPLGDFVEQHDLFSKSMFLAVALVIFETVLTPREVTSTNDETVVLKHYSDLRPRLAAAFETGSVSIDVAGYSSETFYSVMSEFLAEVLRGELLVRRLQVRLLLPDCRQPMAIPCDTTTLKENSEYKRLVIERADHFIDEFGSYFRQIAPLPFIEVATFEARVHDLAPLFKFVIINDREAFFGIYPLAETPAHIGTDTVLFWDYRGERAQMVGASSTGLAIERELLNNVRLWFNSVWESVARRY